MPLLSVYCLVQNVLSALNPFVSVVTKNTRIGLSNLSFYALMGGEGENNQTRQIFINEFVRQAKF